MPARSSIRPGGAPLCDACRLTPRASRNVRRRSNRLALAPALPRLLYGTGNIPRRDLKQGVPCSAVWHSAPSREMGRHSVTSRCCAMRCGDIPSLWLGADRDTRMRRLCSRLAWLCCASATESRGRITECWRGRHGMFGEGARHARFRQGEGINMGGRTTGEGGWCNEVRARSSWTKGPDSTWQARHPTLAEIRTWVALLVARKCPILPPFKPDADACNANPSVPPLPPPCATAIPIDGTHQSAAARRQHAPRTAATRLVVGAASYHDEKEGKGKGKGGASTTTTTTVGEARGSAPGQVIPPTPTRPAESRGISQGWTSFDRASWPPLLLESTHCMRITTSTAPMDQHGM